MDFTYIWLPLYKPQKKIQSKREKKTLSVFPDPPDGKMVNVFPTP